MTTIPENNRLDDVAILRTIAIIAVVLYHVYWAFYFSTNETFRLATVGLSSFYETFFHTWFGARMPLFIFISGYLYSYLFNKRGKYASTTAFIKKKCMHLLIPYFIFTTLMVLCFQDFQVSNFFGGYRHLWFILMMFWCFVFIRLFYKIKNMAVQILVFILFLFGYGYVPMMLTCFGLDTFLKSFCWFWLGYIVWYNREKIQFFFRTAWILLFFFIWFACCYYMEFISSSNWFGQDLTRDVCLIISRIAFVFFIYSIVNKALMKGWIKIHPWIEEMNRYSYGIYIFHHWIIRLTVYQPFRGTNFHQTIYHYIVDHPIIAPILFFFIFFLLSLFITRSLLKTSIGRFLIG
ncbi:MAG: acyltransferase [Tannerellaceae bacterium]|nr:acyltransferase [Tannerellaceae bacterium]